MRSEEFSGGSLTSAGGSRKETGGRYTIYYRKLETTVIVNYCGMLESALQTSRAEYIICPSIEFTHYVRMYLLRGEPSNQQVIMLSVRTEF
jgi:hypothetical protein